jgi:hypothetical protein
MLHGEFDGDFIPSHDWYLRQANIDFNNPFLISNSGDTIYTGEPWQSPECQQLTNDNIQADIIGKPTPELYIVFSGIGFTMYSPSHKNVYGSDAMIELQPFHGNQVVVMDALTDDREHPVSFDDQVDKTFHFLEKLLETKEFVNPEKIRFIGYSQGGHVIAALLDRITENHPLFPLISSIYITSPAAVSNEGKSTLKMLLTQMGKKNANETVVINNINYGAHHIEEVMKINLVESLKQASQRGVKVVLSPEYPESRSMISIDDLNDLNDIASKSPTFFVQQPPRERKHIPGHRDGSITLLQALGVRPQDVGEPADSWQVL